MSIPLKKYVVAFFALGIATILTVVLLRERFLPNQVPLFYGLPEGEEQLSSSLGLVVPNLISITILLINVLISLFTKDEFLKKTLIITGFVAISFATITTIRIILLVGSF